ncbi:MAG: LytTR family DNA-binding domain-containing protein [Candidatus Cohnella colombiensis]|uniref:LytTR family DNA-binding domain-containing protein n=1 Tax=Candidatus Cohnella colombiensis TaxID=3121368 RepID=A0AA95EWR6_9BACL|nr:MAG: LytTR family DNA-binding domain-containing protein [Cohnella sp.]
MSWNGYFSLMKDADGDTGLLSVNANEILYFCVVQNRIIAHTLQGEFYTGWASLDLLWRALKVSDPNFYRTDRAYIANLNKVVSIDREWCKLYFKDEQTDKHCYVARSKLAEIENRLHDFNA